jgi:hypothetical protein
MFLVNIFLADILDFGEVCLWVDGWWWLHWLAGWFFVMIKDQQGLIKNAKPIYKNN